MILDFSSNDTLYTKSLVNDAEEDSVQPQKWQKGELGGADAGRVYAEGLRPQRCVEEGVQKGTKRGWSGLPVRGDRTLNGCF